MGRALRPSRTAGTVYPYLLRNLTVSRINQVWAAEHPDGARLRIPGGGHRLVFSAGARLALVQHVGDFCVEAVNEAVARYDRPEIFNTDQGSQFTSEEFTRYCLLLRSRSAWMAKVAYRQHVERLWRSLSTRSVYLAYDSVQMAREGIACYFEMTSARTKR